MENPALFQTPTAITAGSAHVVLCRKSVSGSPTATMRWLMMPICGSRRNFQTMPIVASADITGKKYTDAQELVGQCVALQRHR